LIDIKVCTIYIDKYIMKNIHI